MKVKLCSVTERVKDDFPFGYKKARQKRTSVGHHVLNIIYIESHCDKFLSGVMHVLNNKLLFIILRLSNSISKTVRLPNSLLVDLQPPGYIKFHKLFNRNGKC